MGGLILFVVVIDEEEEGKMAFSGCEGVVKGWQADEKRGKIVGLKLDLLGRDLPSLIKLPLLSLLACFHCRPPTQILTTSKPLLHGGRKALSARELPGVDIYGRLLP